LPDNALTTNLAAKYGPTLITRITHSYKPRQIALLAPSPNGSAGLLIAAGFSDRLVANGDGIEIPAPNDAPAIAKVRATLIKAIAASEAP
jgi:hypothetical protein